MKSKLEKLPEKLPPDRKMSLYRRKTDNDDLIVLSLGSAAAEEDLVTSVKLDGVQIDIALISKPRRRRERVISEEKPVLDDSSRD